MWTYPNSHPNILLIYRDLSCLAARRLGLVMAKTGNRMEERECSLTVISSNTIISPYLECLAKRGAGQKTARVRWSLNTIQPICLSVCAAVVVL